MNAAHFHLVLNHIPLVGSVFVGVLLALGVARKSGEIMRVALYFLVATSLFAIPTYLTGEPAEEIAESLPDVSTFIMEDHEESALYSLVALEVSGALALGGLIAYRRAEIPRWLASGVLIALIIGIGSTGWTAYLGGQIRHTEIRSDFK